MPEHRRILEALITMKFNKATIAGVILSTTTLSQAWIFGTPRQQFDGDDNFSCTAIYVDKGEEIDFDVGVFESCVLRIYNDAACSVQIGISSRDWDHVLSRPMFAFDIQDC